MEAFALETPLWLIALRGTVVYFAIWLVLRLMPKRSIGNLSANDVIALVIIGSLAADAILGEARSATDLLLMILVVLFWDHLFNLAEFHFPGFRRIAQHAPTLLIYKGVLLKDNLSKEKLTEEELGANLRRQGVSDLTRVEQAILEADGHISVVEKKDG